MMKRGGGGVLVLIAMMWAVGPELLARCLGTRNSENAQFATYTLPPLVV